MACWKMNATLFQVFSETATSVKENIEFSTVEDNDSRLESLLAFLKL